MTSGHLSVNLSGKNNQGIFEYTQREQSNTSFVKFLSILVFLVRMCAPAVPIWHGCPHAPPPPPPRHQDQLAVSHIRAWAIRMSANSQTDE